MNEDLLEYEKRCRTITQLYRVRALGKGVCRTDRPLRRTTPRAPRILDTPITGEVR